MSRISRKSELSPSITKSGGGIDLGKNDIDMGSKGKTSPSVTSGGIGVSTEVTNIGGLTVTGGVSVDISPIDLGIIYDPSENSLGIAGGAQIPGGLLGASGGITVDLNTGEVIGGQIGGEALGLGVSVSASKDGGLGVEFTVQIPFTPIEISLGFGYSPEKTPTPTPAFEPIQGLPPPMPPAPPGEQLLPLRPPPKRPVQVFPENGQRCYYAISHLLIDYDFRYYNKYEVKPHVGYFCSLTTPNVSVVDNKLVGNATRIDRNQWSNYPIGFGVKPYDQYNVRASIFFGTATEINSYLAAGEHYFTFEFQGTDANPGYHWRVITFSVRHSAVVQVYCPNEPPVTPPSPPPPPFPNPPPRKRNMDECCRDSIKLQRAIFSHLGVGRSSGQENLPDGVKEIGSTREGIRQAYPFVVKKRWIDPNAKANEGIPILNDRQLALVLGGMIERLERVLGTAEFYKDSDGKLRQSEGNMLSWLTGKNKDFKYPDPNDFWLNTDDGVINEKLLEVRSVADGLRYQIEALNRLERILPIAELKDSSIPARWIYPNGKGQLRVGNLIHLCEYMIRKSDKDMGYWPQKITIKAANPAIKDDEPITTDVHSQADMLRVILQQILDIEGDGDMGSNYDLRRTYLDVMAFQLTAKNNKYLQAITEYLSFDMTEEVSKIPIPFDPFAGQDRSVIEDWWIKLGFGKETLNLPTKNTESEIERLSESLLQNSEIEVNTVKFGSLDERKEPKTLKESLLEILKHTSAASAAVTEVASEGALDRVVDAAGLAQKLASFLMRRDIREGLGIGDLDNWISSAETGYTENLETESLRFPESSSAEPYGRPATQNPVIREIDTKEDKAD